MISETQLRELLAQRAETKNLDCKEFFNWSTASNDEKCALVKDILAFMNTQDGGNIILGVSDSTLEPVGLKEEDFVSFDTTTLNDFLHKYTDPPTSCDVQKLTSDGRRHVVISIPEFKDLPIICKKDANSSKDSSKLILKASGLYIRTDNARSIQVPNAEVMRELMNRALLRRGDQLLSTIEKLLTGKSVPKEQEVAKYNRELRAAREYFQQKLPDEFEKGGYWQLVSMPDTYNSERISNISSALRIVLESEVSLRGWNYPHTDKENRSNFTNGIQSYTNFGKYIEAYRAYQSGLFVWRGAYREDDPSFAAKYGKALSFVNVIYEMTEMFLFLKRLYERVAPEATIHVVINLRDIKDRTLVSTEVLTDIGGYTSAEPELTIEKDYTVAELRATAEELAIAVVQKIFEVFNWIAPDPNMIRMWQQKLLSRTF
jgi:hypothetical protein